MIRWEGISKDLGYGDEAAMWRDLYGKYSAPVLATRFGVSVNTVRDQLRRHSIQLRPQGGANFRKVVLDEDMIREIRARGVREVAKERDIDVTTIYKLMKKKGLTPREAKPVPVQEEDVELDEEPDATASSQS